MMRQHYQTKPNRNPCADVIFSVLIGLFFALFLFFNL